MSFTPKGKEPHLIGGYNPDDKTIFEISFMLKAISIFFYIPLVILENNKFSQLTLTLFIFSSIYYCIKNVKYLSLIIVSLILVLLPLLPVWKNLEHSGRYLFFPWWLFSVYSAILFSSYKKKYIYFQFFMGGMMLILVILSSYHTSFSLISKGVYKCHDVVSEFILNSTSKQVFFDTDNSWYSSSALAVDLIESEKLIDASPHERAKIVSDITQFSNFNFEELDVFSFDENCQCMTRMNNKLPDLIKKAKLRRKNRPLFFNLRYENHHILWDMGPYEKGSYKLLINITNSDSKFRSDDYFILSMPKKGSIGFSLKKELTFYVIYFSPTGWFVKSERLSFMPIKNPELKWVNNVEK